MPKKHAKKELGAFMEFVRKQGVVGMAVGLAIGVAAAGAVSDIVEGLINPVVGFLLAGTDLTEATWNTGFSRAGEDLVLSWGLALNGILVLLATAFVVYMIVHKAKLDRLDKKKED
jgi:large conductance mechanosensitive channel